MDQAKEAVDLDESNATNSTIFAMGAEFGKANTLSFIVCLISSRLPFIKP